MMTNHICFFLLFMSIPQCGISDMLYIVTSPQSACPENYTRDVCLTLNQLSAYLYRVTSLNLTLEMQPGNHSLDSGLSIFKSSIDFFKMQPSSGAVANIICNGNETDYFSLPWFSLTVVSKVIIKGITFSQCGLVEFDQIISLDISNVSFLNCRDDIHISDNQNAQMTAVSLSQCKTLFVTQTVEFTFQNSTVQDSHMSSGAAAIVHIIQGTNATFAGSLFSSNLFSRVLEIDLYHSAVINNCTFYQNSDLNGPALYSFDSTVVISESIFSHNSATCHGGAVFIYFGALTVLNSTFLDNEVGHHSNYYCSGGAIHIEYGSLTVIGSTFDHNQADQNDGGAICNYHGGSLVVTNCTFRFNQVGGRGGALCSTNSTIIEKSVFINNRAKFKEGGAIYVSDTDSDTVFIRGNTFINNTALSTGGGAIYSTTSIEISESTFTSNSASYCGVLKVEHGNSVSISMCTFESSQAMSENVGGGVACITDSHISVINSSFRQNSAGLDGGVFLIDGSKIDITSSTFTDNYASHDGGVMNTNSYPTNYTITNSNFSSNGAGNSGGVMFVGGFQNVSGSDVRINQSSFSYNHANERGGVFDIGNYAVLKIQSANIFKNSANHGGVISACNSEVTVSSTEGLIKHNDTALECILYDEDDTTTTTESIQTTTTGEGTRGVAPTTTAEGIQTTTAGEGTTGVAPTHSQSYLLPYVLAGLGGVAIVIALIVVLVLILVVCLRKSTKRKAVSFTRKSESLSYARLSEQEDFS